MNFNLIKKSDAVISSIIGFLVGIFFFIILRNLGFTINYDWILLIAFPPLSFLGMLLASVIGKKFLVVYQAAKFCLTGALNTFVDLGVLNLLIWITGIASGYHYSIFKAISFVVAATNSYLWNKHWTFEKKGSVFSSGEFAKFFGVTFIGFLINVGVASVVVNVIGPQYGLSGEMWANIGAFVAVFFAFVWNFVGSKFIVFKK